MKNMKVRTALFKTGMHHYELAEKLEISEITLSRRLRRELPEDEQKQLVELIEREGKHGT